MKKLKFENGDSVDSVGLGTWKVAPDSVYRAVRDAINIGYRHIDCAWIYQNEEQIGLALSDAFKAGDVTRSDLWVTSKLWNSFHAASDVAPALKDSLQKLNLDYLDLYLMHWPIAQRKEAVFPQKAKDYISLNDLPLGETWKAMEVCHEAGLVRHIGVSNFNIPKLRGLMEGASVKPEMNQIELHPFLAQTELLAFCEENGVHVTAYSPLASPDFPDLGADMNILQHAKVQKISEKLAVTPAQVVLQWGIARGTAVIPRSTNSQRLQENLAAAAVNLADSDIERLNTLDQARRVIDGSNWSSSNGLYSQRNIWEK